MFSNSSKRLLVSSFLIVSLIFIGCSQNEETAKTKEVKLEKIEKKEISNEIKVEKPSVKKVVVPDFVGKWSGKFDSRVATLVISEQNETSFKGKISVNYRTVSKQDVEGTIDFDTKKLSMKDMLHSRAKGVYSATLSEDFKTMEGLFTMNLDGKKLKFKLIKK